MQPEEAESLEQLLEALDKKIAKKVTPRTVPKAVGVSKDTVLRVCRDNGLKPLRIKSFKVSNDPKFAEELVHVVAIYLNPPDLDLHLIVDNYTTHKHSKVKNWLKRHQRFLIHYIPTSSLWLNVIELWFRDITCNRIRNGVFRSVEQFEQAIRDYINHHIANPTTFVWTK